VTARLRRAHPREWRRYARRLALRFYYAAQRRRPVDENLAVYAAYWATAFGCNPAAIYAEAGRSVPQVRGVWVIKAKNADRIPPGTDYVLEGSPKYYRVMARAKYLINNVNFPNDIVKRPGTVHVQTQHGTPLKSMGMDLQRYPTAAATMDFRRLMRRSARWDYLVSANHYSTQVWRQAFPGLRFEVLETGYPRNDRLVRATAEEIADARADLGIDQGTTAILYAPTFRDWRREVLDPPLDLDRFCSALPHDTVLLVRGHYWSTDHAGLQRLVERGALRDVSGRPSVEDVLLAADVLLTDYSSIMFDYADLDRPIVIYAGDWERYVRERGTYFDLLAEPPGVVETTEDGLIDAFRSGRFRSAEAAALRTAFRERFCAWDDGHAAERVVQRVFLGRAT
jgi:CDP-glycerol glycerophosphotransferase